MFPNIVAISIVLISLTFTFEIDGQHLPLCDSLNELEGNDQNASNSEVKIRRVRALCDAIYASRSEPVKNELDAIPDFDLTQLHSGKREHAWRTEKSQNSMCAFPFRSGCWPNLGTTPPARWWWRSRWWRRWSKWRRRESVLLGWQSIQFESKWRVEYLR